MTQPRTPGAYSVNRIAKRLSVLIAPVALYALAAGSAGAQQSVTSQATSAPAQATPGAPQAVTPPAPVAPITPSNGQTPAPDTSLSGPVTIPQIAGMTPPTQPVAVPITPELSGPPQNLTLEQVLARVADANPTVKIAQERIASARDAIGQITAQRNILVDAEADDTLSSEKSFSTQPFSLTPPNTTAPTVPTVIDDAANGLFTAGSITGGASGAGLTAGTALSATGSTTTTTSTLTIVPVTAAPGVTPSSSPTGGGAATTGAGTGNASTPTATPQVQLDPDPSRFWEGRGEDPESPLPPRFGEYLGEAPHATSGSGSSGSSGSGSSGLSAFTSLGQYNNWGATVSATKLFDVFGVVSQAEKIARETVTFYQDDLDRTLNELALTTKNVYFAVIEAQANVATSQEQVKNAQATVDDATVRFNAGTVAHYDVVSADAQLSSAQQALIAAQNNLAVQMASLNNLMHQPIDTNLALANPPLPTLPATYDAPTEVGHAYANRPEVREAQLNIDLARRSVKLTGSGLHPVFGLGLGGTYNGNISPLTGTAASATLTAQVTWPIWDGGATRSRVRVAKDSLTSQQVTLDQTKQNVDLEVRSALLNVVDSATLVDADQTEVSLSLEALRLARVRYDAGTGTLLEVTNAEATLATSEYNLASAEYQLQTQYASLERAEGTR